MKRSAYLLAVSLLAFAILALAGCSQVQYEEERHEQSRETLGKMVADEWEKATGEQIRQEGMDWVAGDKMSESHSVMASMILMGNGMDSDLSKYKDLSLVSFVDASGTERAAVVVDNRVILPKAADAAPETPTGDLAP